MKQTPEIKRLKAEIARLSGEKRMILSVLVNICAFQPASDHLKSPADVRRLLDAMETGAFILVLFS